MSPLSELQQTAEEIHFSILLNNCCRELTNSAVYGGVPRYDDVLAHHFQQSGHDLHLKFDFPAAGAEVYAPLRHRSDLQMHQYFFPVIERKTATAEVTTIGVARFMELVISEVKTRYEDVEEANMQERLQNSMDNMAFYLQQLRESGKEVNAAHLSFIEAEQRLAIGHSFHPLSKGRQGFSEEDRLSYSPETAGQFQLHYFLVHPDQVVEACTAERSVSEIIRTELQKHISGKGAQVLETYPSWKVVPAHPWEARYLLAQPEINEMMAEGRLLDLGTHGLLFTPTSSVRTVYNEESDWMLKFSLHVKITSAERVNYLGELHRGYHFSQFLQTAAGKEFGDKHPHVVFMDDPGFLSVFYKGKTINGFNTILRHNPFKKESDEKNAGLLASVCQPAVLGQPARLVQIIREATAWQEGTIQTVSAEWFRTYLRLLLPATVTMFEQGFICELHQQNTVLELDKRFFPSGLYLRDNQSYLFSERKKEALCALLPELAGKEELFIADNYLHDLLSHFLMVSNIMSLINAFAANGLLSEKALTELLYQEVHTLHRAQPNSFTAYLLEKRHWSIKANLLTAIRNIDGGKFPVEVVFQPYPNMLHRHYFSEQLIHPQGTDVFYSRYFPKEDVTISLRPVDLENDLEMLHEWFHREHAIKIWKMNWPLRELEVYYRTMLPGDAAHSYIGEANGVPTFNIEVYWACKDMVGDYYEVLPTDYGTHQFIAPTDPKLKYASPSTQCMVDYVFAQPEVGKMVGEGAVDSLASMMNKAHVGFKIEKVIEMPHKKANLNFCYREWYWAKFPQNKDIQITACAQTPLNA